MSPTGFGRQRPQRAGRQPHDSRRLLSSIQLDLNAGAQAPRIYNVRLVDAGEQFVKSSARTSGTSGANNGIVEYSIMEYTTTAITNYTNGVDVHQGASWIVRHNLFRNIRAPAGQLAGPAVLMWNGSRDSIIENNLFLNVQYGIALGLNGSKADDHMAGSSGIIFSIGTTRKAETSASPSTTQRTPGSSIIPLSSAVLIQRHRIPFSKTMGVEIRYNLMDAGVQQRDELRVLCRTTSPMLNRAGLLIRWLETSTLQLLPTRPSIKLRSTPAFPQTMTPKLGPKAPFPILGLMNFPRIAVAGGTYECPSITLIISGLSHIEAVSREDTRLFASLSHYLHVGILFCGKKERRNP